MKSPRRTALIVIIVLLVVGIVGGVFANHQLAKKRHQQRLVATTYAVVQIADKLKLPLVGVPTTANKMPARYKNVTKVGNPMNPSAEKIASLKPTAVYSVTTLKDQFGKSFKQQHIKPYFLNLQSVSDLQQTVNEMGKQYDRKAEAKLANQEINQAITKAQKRAGSHQKPRVLVLMGLPGAGYMIATNHSYVGDLVRIAGGKNVFTSKDQEYIQPSDEAIQKTHPQVILRLEHAMPTMVTQQFNSEFKSQSFWRQTPAVRSKRVYDLQEPDFDATANMHAAKALGEVSKWLYPGSK
ncbi:heme ABC transporter substrate-binding protein IsdE [Lactobacillus sp. LC28-10]|uniref:High-affinity heme uptake system protein IsdE n=1 Tax=Secundilactobacillus angelensis TaxID=2722706 RepID=A0ABX1L0P2_9LACO|nr:heme ABC transporter substrate-binding protein IsdE [Secundilactobacillus angelensis]MCH5462686.1 heme ABC transporter substrate-binding protein IsdE [Secundilactobacillus angelensis]NLR18798.1 heme ABC transporter substrate-binding protein IsdE [Secundilactobacillus angelensis]